MADLVKRSIVAEIEITPEILRQLQQIQLECLIELDRVCRKHEIRYSLDGGTLLGAVRHKGFIPWDDDIDVIMTRAEYEKLFEVCKTELNKDKFFLQEHRTDPYYRVGYPRIKRNNSTYIRAGQEKSKQRGGVHIDVFVLDNMPESWILRRLNRGATYFFRKILWSRTGKDVSTRAAQRAVYHILDLIPAGFAFWGFDMTGKICNRRPATVVRHYAMTYPNPKVNGYGIPAELTDSFTELEFEGRSFKAVAEYDRYLTLLYRDYMVLPPEEKRSAHIHLSAFEPVREE